MSNDNRDVLVNLADTYGEFNISLTSKFARAEKRNLRSSFDSNFSTEYNSEWSTFYT